MTARTETRYAQIADAIINFAEHWRAPPDLAHAAAAAGLSPWHFQREFKRWVGISPKQFQGQLTLARAKAMLTAGAPVLDAALAAGLSGPSRLHDLAVTMDAMSPGEIRRRGAGLTLRHGTAATPFGPIFLANSERGIVSLRFIDRGGAAAALQSQRRAWPKAVFSHDDAGARDIAARLFAPRSEGGRPLRLAPSGTNFQIKVWQALLAIPPGGAATYAAIARALERPAAARAVGNACAANPIVVLIPCHRVLRESGALGGYAFGTARKRALLAFEAARADR